ncbi:MAG: SDR family oxidoreductase [Gammaproteobacteria bacterium]|nr:SDR family oxidoreductase [Gammaproteobacteria bacterium]
MTKSLARVLGPEVRVNAVCPGFIQGAWLRQGMGEETYDRTRAWLERSTPLQMTATPDTVAEVDPAVHRGGGAGDRRDADAGRRSPLLL